MTPALVAGLLAGYAIAMPVGPVATYLVSLTARSSLRVGSAAALGVASVDGLYALAAAAGGDTLAGVVRRAAGDLRLAAAVVLLYVAGRGAVRAWHRYRAGWRASGRPLAGAGPMRPARAFGTFIGLTAVNPATFAYFAALVAGGGHDLTSAAELMVFAGAAWVASASWQLALACGGALAGRVLAGQRGQLLTALASSLIIGTLAIRMLVPG